jgi:hypothetical protein
MRSISARSAAAAITILLVTIGISLLEHLQEYKLSPVAKTISARSSKSDGS